MAKEDILETKISILKEIADTIVSTDNIDSISNLVLDLALNYTGAKTGSILLLDENDNLIVKAAHGMDAALINTLRLKIGDNICGKVALERKPLLVKDIESDERVRKKGEEKYKTKSFICCPVLMKDKLLGVINISDKKDGAPFTEDELDLISILANQAAIALENARLMCALRSKSIELDETNKGLIEADRVKTEFLARMSHELRTPLNSIKGAVYYLKEKKIGTKAEQAEFFNIISDETQNLITLLEDCLDFSRLNTEGYLLKKRLISLNEILHDVLATKAIKKLLKDKNLSIISEFNKDIPDIIGDKIRIFQLFINLIEGIVKYTENGDIIMLKTIKDETTVEVDLCIKNREISEKEIFTIFDSRYLWSWTDKNKNKLKFYLTKKTVELHKGTIHAQNSPEGFLIKITFPKSVKEQLDAGISELMNLFITFTAHSMGLNTCSLMLKDELTGDLTIKAAYGIDENIIKMTRLRPGEQIAGWVAIEKKPLLVEDVEKDPRISKNNSVRYNTKSLLSIPVLVHESVAGVLNLNNKSNGETFDTKDLYLASAICTRISHILEKLYKHELKEKDFKVMNKGMDALLTAGEKYRKDNRRLMNLVFQMMKELGADENEISMALYTSVVYDLGLTQIDDSILQKSQELSALEQRIIKTHSISSVGLLNSIEFSEKIKKIILHHHERYDGSGYPEGLKGEDIPLISRVLAVADAFTAMTTEQPYRQAFDIKTATQHINSAAGTQFDPQIVDAFNRAVKKTVI